MVVKHGARRKSQPVEAFPGLTILDRGGKQSGKCVEGGDYGRTDLRRLTPAESVARESSVTVRNVSGWNRVVAGCNSQPCCHEQATDFTQH